MGREESDAVSRLADRVAIVTGSTRGIGLRIAQRLADDGARVVVNGRVRQDVDAAVARLRAGGADAVGTAGDVRVEEDVRRIVDTAFAAFGRLDVLVNNAGIVRVAQIVDTTT